MKTLLTILPFLINFFHSFSQSLETGVVTASLKSQEYNSSGKERNAHFSYSIEEWMKNKKPAKTILGYTNQSRPVEAYYFPGTSDKKALIVGGMHGSELSSIEMAGGLIEVLSAGEMPYYNVVVIPALFPDNAVKAMLANQLMKNVGRYTTEESADPNRQMPEPGEAFNKTYPFDRCGRMIEIENQFLLQLIQDYRPARIASLHAIKDVTKAGIYADPRTDCRGYALGFETDSSLAVLMADFIESNGGDVGGNALKQCKTALYHFDPEIAATGFPQKRNFHGSSLPNNRGEGASLGGWATTAVCEGVDQRSAARLITVEFPGYQPSFVHEGTKKERCMVNIQQYIFSLRKIFLEAHYVE